MTKKIFQDDGQRVELGSLGKSGQGLARQGLLGGMGWSWWSRQINLHAMRPKTHKWLPSWSQDDVCGATVAQPHAYLHGRGFKWVGWVISFPDTIFDKYYLHGRGLGGVGHIMPRHDIICIQPTGAAPEFSVGMRGLRADIAF